MGRRTPEEREALAYERGYEDAWRDAQHRLVRLEPRINPYRPPPAPADVDAELKRRQHLAQTEGHPPQP